ncbi:uncharacterized protein [Argopecten irradians]|uniref:uncharacterized protein n=1 Tax=Argopecten irradians TaxID=31199 RepID=UPI00371A518D
MFSSVLIVVALCCDSLAAPLEPERDGRQTIINSLHTMAGNGMNMMMNSGVNMMNGGMNMMNGGMNMMNGGMNVMTSFANGMGNVMTNMFGFPPNVNGPPNTNSNTNWANVFIGGHQQMTAKPTQAPSTVAPTTVTMATKHWIAFGKK